MIQDSAMLVDMSLSVWTGRKQDKKVAEEIDAAKNTQSKAGNYNKNLLAGATELAEVQKIAAAIRVWHYTQTLPWADNGSRLLPMANFFTYKQGLAEWEMKFNDAVQNFLSQYSGLVRAAAFQLGDLFDLSEYPQPSKLEGKFQIRYVFLPVPDVGDFRVSVGNDHLTQLKGQYETYYETKLSEAMQDAWGRLHGCLTKLSEKLSDADVPRATKKNDGNVTQIFRDSLVTNTMELCDLLARLNVTNDSKLEHARRELESAMCGLTAQHLRDSDATRLGVKDKVDQILSMF